MQVRYYDECKWVDAGDGFAFDFVDSDGQVLAHIALRESDSKLWLFQLNLPDRFRIEGSNVGGVVFSQVGARKVVEAILLNTIVTK